MGETRSTSRTSWRVIETVEIDARRLDDITLARGTGVGPAVRPFTRMLPLVEPLELFDDGPVDAPLPRSRWMWILGASGVAIATIVALLVYA
jgi:hypothetical protein